MRQKKNKKLLIIIISLVVLIVVIGISIVCFATDIFKGNKELFFKYVSQMNGEESFFDAQLKTYFEKLKRIRLI